MAIVHNVHKLNVWNVDKDFILIQQQQLMFAKHVSQ